MSNSLTTFTKANGENLATLAKESRPILETVGTYSTTFPCFLKAHGQAHPATRQRLPRGHAAHQRRGHRAARCLRRATRTSSRPRRLFDAASTGAAAKNGKDIRADNAAVPSCLDLNEINKGNEQPFSSQDNPFSIPASVYKLVGIKSPHAKFGAPSEFNRAAAVSLADLVQPSVVGIDSESERSELNILLGARLGMNPSDVPDIGSLLVGPMLRGSGVSLS